MCMYIKMGGIGIESSGSVVECLTGDRGPRVRASPAYCVVVLEQDTFILA